MLKFLIFAVLLSISLAWDPSLKIAEKIAIPHHIRHGYDYPYINMAQLMNRPVRQGLSLQPSPFEVARPQPQGFQRQLPPAAAPVRGFQSQPFEQSQGFSPVRQTRFFERFNGNSRPSEFNNSPRSNTFFNRRLS